DLLGSVTAARALASGSPPGGATPASASPAPCQHPPNSGTKEHTMSITVYTKPDCVQCDATKRALNKSGIAYDLVDLTEDRVALESIKALGYAQAPVVVTSEDRWSGFRPDKLKELA